jgi:putative FmdB family regulatory protein
MPIYDYQCRSCRQRFELLVRADDKPVCPACGAADPQRFFPSSAAVSTGRTRAQSAADARGKATAVKREKDAAHREYFAKHTKDHS